MRITKKQLGITTAVLGIGALIGLRGCDDTYPDIAIAFNTHGHANAARHMDINQARQMAYQLCASSGGSNCSIRYEFTGSSAYCVNAGMYINDTGQMTYTAMTYNAGEGENENIALDTCNLNDRNVCIPQHFIGICNHP